ncbi:MAG TPA: hypothetical protein VKT76_16730 [Bradyrhizobium sp.]|nr:hypothetical protein [Bradyrhizobium sp.]
MSGIAATTSRITPLNEKLYHQSNLLGDWKGSFNKTNQPVDFKVLSINGSTAQVTYTHNGQTERGTATVSQNSITFGNVTIATRNGQQAAFEFAFQPAGQLAPLGTQTAILNKTADPTAPTNPLVGAFTGADADHSVSFQVTAINGRDAQVTYVIDGNSGQGTGDVDGNAVLLNRVQFSNIDGTNGKVTFQSNGQTFSIPVSRFTPKTA